MAIACAAMANAKAKHVLVTRKLGTHAHWEKVENTLGAASWRQSLWLFTFVDLQTQHLHRARAWAGIIHDPQPATLEHNPGRNIFMEWPGKSPSLTTGQPYGSIVPFLSTCVHLFVMSEKLRRYALPRLAAAGRRDLPVTVLSHPLPNVTGQWDPRRSTRTLYQFGNWLRRTHAIFRVDAPAPWRKVIAPDTRWTRRNLADTMRHDGLELSAAQRNSTGWARVSDAEYREALSTGVVLLDVYGSTANNVILECIAYSTPLIVRRMPGIEHYLTPKCVEITGYSVSRRGLLMTAGAFLLGTRSSSARSPKCQGCSAAPRRRTASLAASTPPSSLFPRWLAGSPTRWTRGAPDASARGSGGRAAFPPTEAWGTACAAARPGPPSSRTSTR